MKKSYTFKIGQSAITGRYTTIKTAIARPTTHIVRTIRVIKSVRK